MDSGIKIAKRFTYKARALKSNGFVTGKKQIPGRCFSDELVFDS